MKIETDFRFGNEILVQNSLACQVSIQFLPGDELI